MHTKHLMIYGRVQGVWYRGWAVDAARSLGLTGWIRNRLDGSVEAVVSGSAAALESFLRMARQGPPAAQVARIDEIDADPHYFDRFEQRPTA
jgi:acylphosphatase